MAVTLDAAGTPLSSGAGGEANTNFNYTGITVGAGSNRALLLAVYFDVASVSGVTVVWDSGGTNQSMALVKTVNTAGANGRCDIYGLVAPTAGNNLLSVNWTTGSDFATAAISFTGVDQTGGVTSFPNSTSSTGNSSSPSLTITSAVGNYTLAVSGNAATAFSTQTQTLLFQDNSLTNGSGDSTYATGAATVAHGFTLASPQQWAVAGTDIAASGGGVSNPGLMWLY